MKKNKKEKLEMFDELTDEPKDAEAQYLTREEIKILRASRADRGKLPYLDNSDMAKAKRFAKKNKKAVIFVCVTVALLLSVVAFLSFSLWKKAQDGPCTDDFVITLGSEEYELKYKEGMKYGKLYIDINMIAEYADITVSGNSKSLKFTNSDKNYAKFENGSSSALVNGVSVDVGGKVIIDDEECLLPFDFIKKLFSKGMVIRLNENDNTIFIHRQFYDEERTQPVEIEFSTDGLDLSGFAMSGFGKEKNIYDRYERIHFLYL